MILYRFFSVVFVVCMLFLYSSCIFGTNDPYEQTKKLGWRPVYVTKTAIQDIAFLEPQLIVNLGKIYAKDSLIFLNEFNKGVHVINNKNPHNPQKIGFIQIMGNKDIAIKNNYLYADNLNDLITIDITNLTAPTVISRVANLYKAYEVNYPSGRNQRGYFECVDTTKGYVLEWVQDSLTNPTCYR